VCRQSSPSCSQGIQRPGSTQESGVDWFFGNQPSRQRPREFNVILTPGNTDDRTPNCCNTYLLKLLAFRVCLVVATSSRGRLPGNSTVSHPFAVDEEPLDGVDVGPLLLRRRYHRVGDGPVAEHLITEHSRHRSPSARWVNLTCGLIRLLPSAKKPSPPTKRVPQVTGARTQVDSIAFKTLLIISCCFDSVITAFISGLPSQSQLEII